MMYDWHLLVGTLSGVIIFAAIIPYIYDVLKGNTKPNAVSWFGWTLLLCIGFFAQIKEGASYSILLIAGDILGTSITFILSLKFGVRKYTVFDKLCLALGLMAIFLWVLTKNPLIALALSVLADLLVSLPTLKKAIQNPFSETPLAFFMFAFAALLGVISTTKLNIANLLFPVYLFLINGLIWAFSYFGRKKKT